MEEETRLDYSKYRFDRAKECLNAAKREFEADYIGVSVNRSYYAIFHALRAVTILDDFDSKKHSGIIAYFNREYIRTRIFDAGTYEIIDSAFKLRGHADYDDFYLVSRKDTQKQINDAEKIINMIQPIFRITMGRNGGK